MKQLLQRLKQVWWWRRYRYLARIAFVIAVMTVLSAYAVRVKDPGLADLLMASGGWALAFTGILLAGEQALRGLIFGALSKLHEDEADPEQLKAKQLVWRASQQPGYSSDNLYSYFRQYVNALSDPKQDELDKARRRMTHFWYRAARLMELGILTPDEIFASVGPPDVVEVLEPLEAILAERINPNWKPRPWPPIKMLITWYEQQGHLEKARELQPQLPARPALYKTSLD
jgi:hypothetical protein